MVSSIAIAAAEGFEPEEKRLLIDEIAADSQHERDRGKPIKERLRSRDRQGAAASPHAPRGPPDDLEVRIGSKLIFSINELAAPTSRRPQSSACCGRTSYPSFRLEGRAVSRGRLFSIS